MCSSSAYCLAIKGRFHAGTKDMQGFTSGHIDTKLRHGSLMQVVQG